MYVFPYEDISLTQLRVAPTYVYNKICEDGSVV